MPQDAPHSGLPAVRLLLTQRLAALAGAGTMRALREGLLWLVPCLLVSAAFLLASALAQMAGLPAPVVQWLAGLHTEISAALPLLVAASIGYMLAIRHRLPRLPVAFLCLVYVEIAAFVLRGHPRAAATLVLFIAIASPLINVPLMARLHARRWTRIARGGLVGESVRDAMNLVVPGIVTAALLAAVLAALAQVPALTQAELPLALAAPESPYRSGVLLAALNSVLWFFGIHGYYAMQPFFQVLDQAVVLNAADAAAGLAPRHALTSGLMGAFVFVGGAGGTLSLSLAALLFCRGRGLRLVALASLPVSLLNVNEILLFGLPVILNPRLLVPFVAVPVLNLALSLAAVQAGWVAAATVKLPFTMPVLLNAYVSTGGDAAAVLLQVLLVGLGTLVYAPYIRALDQAGREENAIHLRAFDTTFTRLPEEAGLATRDPVEQAHREQARRETVLAHIRRISEYDFHLEYQPQVALPGGRCTGCEALLRARDRSGATQPPGTLLPWLAEAGLMREVDLWVAGSAVQQHRQWSEQGFALPISINVTGATLTSPGHCERLVKILARAGGQVGIEITEEALAGDVPAIRQAIARIHAIGAKVAIDDFGTGYSSLSYLHQFDVDVIKIDRSFVIARDDPKGAQVMDGLLRLCEALRLPTVVEGVETEAQCRALQSPAGLIVQGWHFSRALPAQEVAAFARGREIHQFQ